MSNGVLVEAAPDVAVATGVPAMPVKPKVSRDDIVMRLSMGLIGLFLVVGVLLPLYAIMSKSMQDKDGTFIGFTNFASYFSTPALFQSIYNSVTVSFVAMVIVIGLGFVYGFALTRTCMPFKGFFKAVALIPILAPSLLPAISLVYLFGNQGIAKELLMGDSIYGPIGIVMGACFWTFPHALMIIITALSVSDARLYEAANVLGASRIQTFLTVTIPGCKYGLISAAFVVFTLVITDFGVPKVIGGQYNVLATDIYKQVVGQQNFEMGAVVSVILLFPAILAFAVDRIVQRKQVALLSARAVPYQPKPNKRLDYTMLAVCGFVAFLLIGIIGMATWASLIKFWPYDMSLTLAHYNFELADGGSWDAYFNSIRMALYTAVFGTAIIFFGAYLVEKGRGFERGRTLFQLLAIVPLAVPGLVLGLAYIFFFNQPGNPFNFLYGSMAIMVICTIVHFYTVSHMTASTALKQMDPGIRIRGRITEEPILQDILAGDRACVHAGDP